MAKAKRKVAAKKSIASIGKKAVKKSVKRPVKATAKKHKAAPKKKAVVHKKTSAAKKPAKAKKSATKAKVKAKSKPKAKAKSKVKGKGKPKAKIAIVKKKKARKSKVGLELSFSAAQQEQLLSLIEKIVNVRKHAPGGLKSFDKIERILDQYNQKYVENTDKFAAIVKYGVEEDPRIVHQHFFVVKDRDPHEHELYKVLADIAHEKVGFNDALVKIQTIYDASVLIPQ